MLLGEEVDYAARATLGDIDGPLTQELDLRTVAAIAAHRGHVARSTRSWVADGASGPVRAVDGAETAGPEATPDVAPEDTGTGEALPDATEPASLGRNTSLMAAGTAVSRLLGFVRNIVLVAAIGATGPVANAFDVANKLPNILFTILAGGVLNAVLVPQIVRAYQSRNPQERLDKLLTLSGALLLATTAILTLASGVVIGVYAKDWPSDQLQLGIAFAYWCIPQLFFYGIYTLLGQVLNARNQFGPFMWAPALNNIVAIGGTLVYLVVYGTYVKGGPTDDLSSWGGTQIALLAGTATLGIAAQAVILLVPLYRGGFRYHPRIGMHGIGLRSVGHVAGWTLLAVVLEQVGIVFITRFATSAATVAVGQGVPPDAVAGNAAYSNALLIYLLPHSLVTVSIATALFTGFARAASAGDLARIRTLLSRGLRTIGVFTIFATAVMAVLAQALTRLFIPTVSSAAGEAIAHVLAAMSFGLVGLGGMVLLKWVYYAFEDGRTVFLIQLPATGLLVGLSWLGTLVLPPQQWVVGIGAAMAISNTLVVLLRSFGVSRTLHGMDAHRVLRQHVRVLVATLVASAVGLGLLHVLPGDGSGSWLASVVVVALVGTVMTAVYIVGLRMLHVTELAELAAPFTGRLRRLVRR
jgi:putative peptidoglycan lipid II flippase